jgi:WD40 repeat protein
MEAGRFEHCELNHPKAVYRMAFCAGDTLLATLCWDRLARIWDPSNGKLVRSLRVPERLGWAKLEDFPQTFLQDGRAVLVVFDTVEQQKLFQLFSLGTGEVIGKPCFHPNYEWIDRGRLSPDGTRLATVGDDQMGYVIDLLEGRLVSPGFRPGGDLRDIDWSPDGRFVITAGLTTEVKLWDASTGQMLMSPMLSGNNFARSAFWSADGRFVVTRSDDGSARVWDATTTEAVTPRLAHSGYIRFACVTPDQRLITASDPNLLRAWDLRPTALPVDVIADCAHLLSGRRLNAGGVLLPIPAKELAELAQSLRARAPQLFE